MAAAVIPTNPSCQGPSPDGKALLPALSTGIQVAALTQSWSRQAALSSLPNRDTGTHCLCNTPAVDFRPGRLLRTWNSQNALQHAGWQNLGRVLPWQREFFQCQGDRTSEYSCTSFCSFLCSLLLWQCLSHVLPAGAARKELNLRSRKYQKSCTYQVPRSVPAGRRQNSRLKLLSLNFSCSWLHTRVISCPMWGFTRFSVHLATILS